jgi:hypothetical protein
MREYLTDSLGELEGGRAGEVETFEAGHGKGGGRSGRPALGAQKGKVVLQLW